MPVFNLRVRTSSKFLPISKTLTNLVNSHQLGAERNMVVSVFSPDDNPDWESLPPIWHRPNGTDIVVNMGKFIQVMEGTSARPGYFLGKEIPRRGTYTSYTENEVTLERESVGGVERVVLANHAIDRGTREIQNRYPVDDANSRTHTTFLAGGKVNTVPLTRTHRFREGSFKYSTYYGYQMPMNLLMGSVIREAAYSVFTQQQVRDAAWFKRATGYQRNIITVFEELRVEAQAIGRIDGPVASSRRARNFVRTATPITANVDQVIADMAASAMSGGEEGASVANVALNASLILGRTVYDVLLRFEVESFHDGVDSLVGTDRLAKMYDIWTRYAQIIDATERNIMPLVNEWIELFPSDDDGSNAQSSVAPAPENEPGEGDEEGEGEGEGEGEDGEGEGEGEGGEGEGEGKDGKDGKGEGEGDGEKEGKGGSGKGTGEGEKSDKEGKGKQTKAASKLKDAKGAEAGRGTKGAHTRTYNAKNTIEKNSTEDPGKDEIISSRALVQSMVGTESPEEKATTQALIETEHESHDYGPKDRTPSRISYNKAEHRHPPKGNIQDELDRGRILAPSPLDYNMATDLAKVLENLNITDRGKFTVSTQAPPGRLRSRAAMQQAAERSLRLPASAEPWRRTKHTVDLNPPLTVGIMTDVSGSMGWAEKFVAEFTWIVQHAVSTINGRAAALAFGNGATVTLRPGERMQYAQVIPANGGGEEFDMGAGTLDTMLNLVDGQGTRMLFVVTDGHFVFENMMPKSRAWIKQLRAKGVHIIWVTPDTGRYEDDDEEVPGKRYKATPDNVTKVSAVALSNTERGTDEYRAASKALMTSLGNEIQKAVRVARMNRRG